MLGETPTTRTHCGGGVTATCRFSMFMASASVRTPSHRSFHVEIQAAADDVKVVVDQTRQDAAPLEVDDFVAEPARASTSASAPTGRTCRPDRDRCGGRIRAVEGRHRS